MSSDWIILRTSSRSTLALSDSLNRHGYDTWTPAKVLMKRAPRCREMNEIAVPMLPSFAFARAAHVRDLADLSNRLTKPCPDFSIFHWLDGIPLISDVELEALRRFEEVERRKAELTKMRHRKRKHVRFAGGETIMMNEGAFAGLSGVVETDDGRYAMVNFGLAKVKIATWLLANDNVPVEA